MYNMDSSINKKNNGWPVCIGCALLLFAVIGILVQSFSIFQPYFISARNFSNTQVSLLMTIRTLTSVVVLTAVDLYYKKTDIKKGLFIAVLIGVLGVVICAFAEKFALMVAGMMLLGLCQGLCSMIPISILINRWFVKNKGLALSICTSASGMATLVIPQLIVKLEAAYGLRNAFLATGTLVLVISVIGLLLIRNSPKAGIVQTDNEAGQTSGSSAMPTRKTLSKAQNTAMVIALAFIGIATGCVIQFSSLHLTSSGFSLEQAASIVAAAGVTLTISKFLYGIVVDKFGAYKTNYFYIFGSAIGVGLCCLASLGNFSLIFGAMVVVGFCSPFVSVGLPLWVADLYPTEKYATSLKNLTLAGQVGTLLFSVVPGIIADKTGGYTISYAIFAFMLLAAGVIVQSVYIKNNRGNKSH